MPDLDRQCRLADPPMPPMADTTTVDAGVTGLSSHEGARGSGPTDEVTDRRRKASDRALHATPADLGPRGAIAAIKSSRSGSVRPNASLNASTVWCRGEHRTPRSSELMAWVVNLRLAGKLLPGSVLRRAGAG